MLSSPWPPSAPGDSSESGTRLQTGWEGQAARWAPSTWPLPRPLRSRRLSEAAPRPAAGKGTGTAGRPADRPAPSTAAVSLSAVIGRRGRAEAPSTIPQRAARSATAARPTAPLYSALKIARRAPPRGSWGGGGSRVAGQSAPPPAVRHHPPRPERRCHWAAVISGAPRTRPSRPAVYPTWSRAA